MNNKKFNNYLNKHPIGAFFIAKNKEWIKMSLCLATVTTSGLLVSVDGRGVMHDKDNHVHVVTDSAKGF